MPRLEVAGVLSIKAHSWRGVITPEFGFKAAGGAVMGRGGFGG